GLMCNPSFEDYKIPGSLEMPELVPLIDDGDTREAVIGVGEPPIIPTVGAIANAVFNACGVRVRELPITPDKILMGLWKGGQTANVDSRSARSSRSRSWPNTQQCVATFPVSQKPRSPSPRRRYATSARSAAISASVRAAGTSGSKMRSV